VLDEEGLTCSVGVATTKFVAKLATEAAKPAASSSGPVFGSGVFAVDPGHELAFLHPLPVQALSGVGPATLARLQRLGVVTVGDLAVLPLDVVVRALGSASGTHLHALARGVDERPVRPDRAPKSVSHEETFVHDHHRSDTLDRELVRLADSVAARLRGQSMVGRTVSIKVRFGDFHTVTRAVTLGEATASAPVLLRQARSLLSQVDPTPGVRLLGLSVTGLGGADEPRQLRFDDLDGSGADESEPTDPTWQAAEAAVDAIRARFGPDAIGPASLAGPGGRRRARQGEQPWGPTAQEPPGDDRWRTHGPG
jgi:DNA polymerase-4